MASVTDQSKAKTYEVEVTKMGWATITAATKKEAREKAERGEFDEVRGLPWYPRISKLIERAALDEEHHG